SPPSGASTRPAARRASRRRRRPTSGRRRTAASRPTGAIPPLDPEATRRGELRAGQLPTASHISLRECAEEFERRLRLGPAAFRLELELAPGGDPAAGGMACLC